MLFNLQQQKTFEILCNTILPADDFPGGLDVGAGEYVLSLLSSHDGAHFVEAYREGLEKLNEEAQARYGCAFVECNDLQRENLLKALEAGDSKTEWTDFKSVFSLWCGHFAEGYYNNPNYGGNRDYASWKMIGFPIEASLHRYETVAQG